MKILLSIPLFLGLSACWSDETVGAYGASDQIWVLQELDATPFTAHATVTFPEAGTIAGKAPCNNFSGPMTAPYPWFEVKNLAVTRMACPDLEAETLFYAALSDMTQSEVSGDTLILTNEAGREMVFKASE